MRITKKATVAAAATVAVAAAALLAGSSSVAAGEELAASSVPAGGTGAEFATRLTSLATTPSSAVYGEHVTVSGVLQQRNAHNPQETYGAVGDGTPLLLEEYAGFGCSADRPSGSANATTYGGTGAFAEALQPTAAGPWSFQVTFAGASPSPGRTYDGTSACVDATVAQAPTHTSIVGSPATSLGLGSSLDVGYLVESGYGVNGNHAGGSVTVQQVSSSGSGSVCGAGTGTAALDAAQNDAADGGSGAGFSASGTLTCTPTAVGTYTYQLSYAGDPNYLGSTSGQADVAVTDVTVQVCKAAPAIAGDYLKTHGVKPGSTTWRSVIKDVAHQTGSKGDFFAQQACQDGYQGAVEAYVAGRMPS